MDVDDTIHSEAFRLLEVAFPRDSVDVLLPIVEFAVVPVVVPVVVTEICPSRRVGHFKAPC